MSATRYVESRSVVAKWCTRAPVGASVVPVVSVIGEFEMTVQAAGAVTVSA